MHSRHPPLVSSLLTGLVQWIICAGLFLAVAGRAAERMEVSFNAGWKFQYAEAAGAEAVAFDDATWTSVSTPHTWNAEDGQDGIKSKVEGVALLKGDYARGTGWYRRIVSFDPAWRDRQLYLQFDGVNRRADVFMNGRLVGTHLGGHARFRFDVTHLLQAGVRNVLAVRVNNEDNGIIPHSGDFTFFGGIYRGVSLVVTDPVQVETMDYASPGVYLRQQSVTAEAAEVQALVKVANHEGRPADVVVKVQVFDAAGAGVTEATGPVHLVADGRGEIALPLHFASPHLWNGRADPYLYRVLTTVSTGATARDMVEQKLGLRFFRVDPQQGFFLNGHYLDLHGASRHQDRLDKGWAISDDDDREDFALMVEMGCTANRVAHYQQSPLWYQLADEQGMVQWAEIPFVDEALPSAGFFNNALEQMRELIRQNYNHPAICFWGCGNENADFGRPFIEGIARYGPISERQIQALDALAHVEDPTRLTTYASYHSEHDVNFALPGQPPVHYEGEPQRWYTDVTAFNKYYGWYYGEPEDNAEFFDSIHKRFPTQSVAVSEYGAGGAITQHEAVNYGGPGYQRTPMESPRRVAFAKFHPEEYQAYYHEEAWKALAARPYIWAKFIWNMFDFASDGRSEGDHPGRNDKGLVTFDRKTRKDAFYFYQANWTTSPVLHLNGKRFLQRATPEADVKVYTNAAEAELFLNGQSVGKASANDIHVARWQGLHLVPGRNTVRVQASFAAGIQTDECVWELVPAAKAP